MRNAYVYCVSTLHMAPSEFWAMEPREFMWLHIASLPRSEHYAGTLTDADVAELCEELRQHG